MLKKIINNNKLQENGIALLTLVVTIIVLLILAGVTLNGIFGNSGIIKNAENAKQQVEIKNEKELIEQANILAINKSQTGQIAVEEMQQAMDNTAGEKTTIVINNGDKIAIKFEKSGRYYNLDENGKIEQFTPYFDTTPGILAQNSDGKYMIESIEDLVVFSAMGSGGYSDENIQIPSGQWINTVLICDLDFKSPLSYGDSTTTIYNGFLGVEEENVPLIEALTNTEKYKGFIPIGNSSKPFSGTFDGENHYIRNLSVNIDDNGGLFGYISMATIKNIIVTGEIKSTTNAGGIVGRAEGQQRKNIFNCVNYANVSSTTWCGGIVGFSGYGAINYSDCTNYGRVEGKNAGGIVGYVDGADAANFNPTFINNSNHGTIIGTSGARRINWRWKTTRNKNS